MRIRRPIRLWNHKKTDELVLVAAYRISLKKCPYQKERVLQTENVCLSVQPIRNQLFRISAGQQVFPPKVLAPRYSSRANQNPSSILLETSAASQKPIGYRFPGRASFPR